MRRPVTITYMTEPSLVDLVGVGLNATDTLIPLPSFPHAAPRSNTPTPPSCPAAKPPPPSSPAKPGDSPHATSVSSATTTPRSLHRHEFVARRRRRPPHHRPDAASPQSLILVDDGGERTVFCRRDERLLLQPADLDRDWIVNARALHVDGFETAAATVAAGWARAAGIPVIADLDELYPGVEDLIDNIDYLIVSRDFPAASPANATSSKPSAP